MNPYNLAELAQTLFEESGDALFLFDPVTEQLADVNPMAQRLTGFPRLELLRMSVRYLFRSEVQGGLNRLRAAYQKTGLFHSQEGFLLRHQLDNHWVPVNLTVTRLHTRPQPLGLITARDVTERRQAQQLLRKKETQLREILSNVSDCLWSAEVGEQGSLVNRYCSPVAERLTGYPVDSFTTPARWVEITHPEDRPILQGALRNLLARASEREEVEIRIQAADGTERWIRCSLLAQENSERRVLVVDGVVSEITQRRQAEEALRQRDRRFRAMVERGTEAIYLLDPEGIILYASPACELLAGRSPEEIQGHSIYERVLPEDIARARQALAQVVAHPEQTVTNLARVLHRDGSIRHIESVGTNRLHDPVIGAIVVHLRDATVRIQTEEKLRLSEARYRTLVDNLAQSIFLKDRDLRFVAVNRRLLEDVQIPAQELLGKTDFDLYPHPLAESYREDDRRVLNGERIEKEEAVLIQGKERTVRTVKTPVHDDRGAVVGVLGIYWDVTEQHRLEQQLRQAQKMEAIGQLAGGVAHDFNNLLTGILGNLALVQMQLPAGTALKEMLATAEQAAWRAATLTSQLLGFSRQTILRVEPLNLNRTIDEVVALLQRTLDPRIHLTAARAADLWTVQADPGQMSQVLMNLCINARDAILAVLIRPEEAGKEGSIHLESANVHLDEVDAARQNVLARAGEYVRLRVIDSGSGISPEILPRIFEPFFTTKGPSKGTGLGLAMVFGILQQHHGWVECHSTVGKGTRFDVYLPRCVESESTSVRPQIAAPNGGTETILVADDEPSLRNLGEMILRRHGYKVLVAEDGLRAVETFRRHREEIALIILDLSMPRLSGRDALRQLRQIKPGIRILITSGYSADALPEDSQREIQGFVPKPFRPETLARAVREALDGPAPG